MGRFRESVALSPEERDATARAFVVSAAAGAGGAARCPDPTACTWTEAVVHVHVAWGEAARWARVGDEASAVWTSSLLFYCPHGAVHQCGGECSASYLDSVTKTYLCRLTAIEVGRRNATSSRVRFVATT